jgi:hypothetical protein
VVRAGSKVTALPRLAVFDIRNPMGLSIPETNKSKGGRPRVNATPVMVRLDPDLLEQVDRWRDNALGQPTRPEAIRRLVKKGLSVPD